ncbi:MAG: 50S ribosomal protein L17, partial [Myxococcales bacterium]|nr:50S ribosomal protein L17 [Myxococcales bacterium]
MRHRKSGRKLGRNSSHRSAMFRNMATSLIEEERIQTTAAKAKELRPIIEKLITLGKRNAPSVVAQAQGDQEKARRSAARVAAVRQAGKLVRNRFALQKLFGDLAERFVGRDGGYTRVLRVGRRYGDNAELAIIELLPEGYEKVSKPKADAPAAEDPVVEAAAEEPAAEVAADEPAAEAAAEVAADEPAAEAAAE